MFRALHIVAAAPELRLLALLLFAAVFAAVFVRTYVLSRREDFDAVARLPLDARDEGREP